MRKLIILIVLATVTTGLYFYHKDNWNQHRRQISKFNAKLDRPHSKQAQEVDLEKEDKDQVIDHQLEIRSPFNSQLAIALAANEEENKVKEAIESKDKSDDKEKIEIQRPNFNLKGIIRIGEYKRVNIEFLGEYKRLSTGDILDGFILVDISKNGVTFKKDKSYFKFTIDDFD